MDRDSAAVTPPVGATFDQVFFPVINVLALVFLWNILQRLEQPRVELPDGLHMDSFVR
jgi:hypothetical protein